jgi:uncharacterized protein (DUF433 family)
MVTTIASLVEVDDRGVAWITGANTKVIQVVLDKIAYGWSPEEIHFQHSHLSLAQIHGALAYYYEHQDRLDQEIQRRFQEAGTLAQRLSDAKLRQRLVDLKRAR